MKLKINESRILEFGMNVNGCSSKNLKGCFRLEFDGMEYGFPAIFDSNEIKVNIPPFTNILTEGMKQNLYKSKEVIVNGRLDIVANNESYILAWEGDVEIEVPISVKLMEKKELKETEELSEFKIDDLKVVEKEENNTLPDKKKSKLFSIFESK